MASTSYWYVTDPAIPEEYDSDDGPVPVPTSGSALIERAIIPDRIKVQDVIKISIVEINSPVKFWFHILQDGQTPHPLNELMYDIRNTYIDMAPNECRLLDRNLVPDQICAALHGGTWHRGRIVKYVQHEPTAMIHLLDFGTTASVPVGHLKYLQKAFAKVPCQAFRGCLDYVRPLDRVQWCRNSTYAFMGMAHNELLSAHVSYVCRQHGIIRMMLIDANDMRINAELIRRGFAKAFWAPGLKRYAGWDYRHVSEYSPTFDELETSRLPSFAEMGLLLGKQPPSNGRY